LKLHCFYLWPTAFYQHSQGQRPQLYTQFFAGFVLLLNEMVIVDVVAAKERGILVGNTPDVLTDVTADIAVGLVLAASRHFHASILQVKALEWKTWEPLGLLGSSLNGKTLGIVGMGRIGAAVARKLASDWNMKVIYTSRSASSRLKLLGKTHDLTFTEPMTGDSRVIYELLQIGQCKRFRFGR